MCHLAREVIILYSDLYFVLTMATAQLWLRWPLISPFPAFLPLGAVARIPCRRVQLPFLFSQAGLVYNRPWFSFWPLILLLALPTHVPDGPAFPPKSCAVAPLPTLAERRHLPKSRL